MVEDGRRDRDEPTQGLPGSLGGFKTTEGVGQRPGNPATGPETGREEMRQDEAPPIDETRLREALRRNRFCRGISGGRGKKYQCSSEETSEEVKDRAVELLTETIRRLTHWHVWDDWWIIEHADEWLSARDRLEIQLRGRYSNEIVKDLLRLVDKFINYNEQFLNYWHEADNEVRKLIEDLLNGRAKVIIRGEDTVGVSVYGEHITLNVQDMSTGITVHLVLKGLGGIIVRVPDVFRKTMSKKEYTKFIKKVLRALRGGFAETDETVDRDKPVMETTQIWQVVVWSLLYFGSMYVHISRINVNDSNVTITWHLRSSHDPLKDKILSDVNKLSEEELLAFTLTAVLGDGWVDVVKPIINGRAYNEAVIKIAMSGEEYKAWEPLLERLKSIGFKCGKPSLINGNAVEVAFNGSNAIGLSRAMMAVLPPILRDILDALSFEKWERIKQIAEMEVKFRRGEMKIEVAGYGFTVKARDDTVELEHRAKDDTEVSGVISALRARYGDGFAVNTRKSGRYRVVAIPAYIFERYDDIKERVIQVLCRKLEKTKDERKRQVITKHLRRLAPTKGAAALSDLFPD